MSRFWLPTTTVWHTRRSHTIHQAHNLLHSQRVQGSIVFLFPQCNPQFFRKFLPQSAAITLTTRVVASRVPTSFPYSAAGFAYPLSVVSFSLSLLNVRSTPTILARIYPSPTRTCVLYKLTVSPIARPPEIQRSFFHVETTLVAQQETLQISSQHYE